MPDIVALFQLSTQDQREQLVKSMRSVIELYDVNGSRVQGRMPRWCQGAPARAGSAIEAITSLNMCRHLFARIVKTIEMKELGFSVESMFHVPKKLSIPV